MSTSSHTTRPALRCLLILPALWMLLAPVSVRAAALSEQDARAAAQTWVRLVPAEARPDAIVERVEPYAVGGMTIAYVATLADSGFCICGADDRALPVYLYCANGAFDPEDDVIQYTLDGLLREMRKDSAPGLTGLQRTFEERKRYWDALRVGTIPVRQRGTYDGPPVVTLPVRSNWNQWSPYNHYTPVLPPGGASQCATGCGANAMAGVMNYWNWPPTGEGSGSTTYRYWYRTDWAYAPLDHDPHIPPEWNFGGRLAYLGPDSLLAMNGYWDESVGERALRVENTASYQAALATLWAQMTPDSVVYSANFGATTYRWNEIRYQHFNPFGPEDDAVATLCYQAGVALGMGYGIWGSLSNHNPLAYANDFQYDHDAELVHFDSLHESEGDDLMIDEIQWMRPVDYQAGAPAHHIWFLQGYDRTGLPDSLFFYQNSGNGSVVMAIIDPLIEGHNFLRYVAPEGVVRFVGAGTSGDGSPKEPYADVDAALGDAPDGTTLVFKAGSNNTFFANTLTISRPMTLKGVEATIQRAK
jgi:hypothetical protein